MADDTSGCCDDVAVMEPCCQPCTIDLQSSGPQVTCHSMAVTRRRSRGRSRWGACGRCRRTCRVTACPSSGRCWRATPKPAPRRRSCLQHPFIARHARGGCGGAGQKLTPIADATAYITSSRWGSGDGGKRAGAPSMPGPTCFLRGGRRQALRLEGRSPGFRPGSGQLPAAVAAGGQWSAPAPPASGSAVASPEAGFLQIQRVRVGAAAAPGLSPSSSAGFPSASGLRPHGAWRCDRGAAVDAPAASAPVSAAEQPQQLRQRQLLQRGGGDSGARRRCGRAHPGASLGGA